ncbi:MAG: right-handed parallel beta-helix repeat-containing protein [Planctomycetota bacterium]
MGKPTLVLSFLVTMSLSVVRCASAKIIHVPDDYPTIQQAIDRALDGDTVLVDPGDYPEIIDFKRKAIRVTSSRGPWMTVIDGDYRWGGVIFFQSGEQKNSILDGFTITRASGQHATGIICYSSSPTITRNLIVNNYAGDDLVYVFHGSPTFTDNVFKANGWGLVIDAQESTITSSGDTFEDSHASYGYGVVAHLSRSTASFHDDVFADSVSGEGGAIHAEASSLLFDHCIIQHNSAGMDGGFLACFDSTVSLNRCLLSGNRAYGKGGAIYCVGQASSAAVTLTSCVFAHNGSFDSGGAVYLGPHSSAVISSCTFFENRAPSGDSITCQDAATTAITSSILWGGSAGREIAEGSSLVTAAYCDVAGGWPGPGNIDADPLLVAPEQGDFSLATVSPCIDAGDPWARPGGMDVQGSPRTLDGALIGHLALDMGAAEFDHVHLASTPFVAGETATLHTSGTPGLTVLLVVGTRTGETPLPPLGALFIDLGSAWAFSILGTIPPAEAFDVQVRVPPGLLVPLPIVLQEIAIQPAGRAGNTSSAIDLVLE